MFLLTTIETPAGEIMSGISNDQIWMVVVGFIIAFILAFGIGANDVANSFGTSVGAKVLTLRQACVLAAIFETLGAVLLGAKVSDTIRKGIIDPTMYNGSESLLMVGNVAALSGSCVWLIAATMLRMPVSATHSIVGATVGFALVAHGAKGINWAKFGMIIGSWFISPVLAGVVSTGLFFFCKFFILSKDDPLEPGLKWLPVFYASTIVINLFSVLYDGPEIFYLNKIPLWGTFAISLGCGLVIAIAIRYIMVPWQRRVITRTVAESAMSDMSRANGEGDILMLENELKTQQGSPEHKDVPLPQHHHYRHLNWLMPPTASSKILTDITHPDRNANVSRMSKPRTRHSSINDDAKQKEPPRQRTTSLTTDYVSPCNGSPMTEVAPWPVIPEDSKLVSPKPEVMNGDTSKNHLPKVELSEEDLFVDVDGRDSVSDRPETARLFSFLQILTAVFGSFAHGGNDVSNAIGPLVGLWLIGTNHEIAEKAATPIWILLYGGAGISIGLFIWGRRVIKTLGEDLTKITPSSGFCIELGSALTVLVASNMGIPISTTHCKVGSVVFVGRFRARENVDWHIFRNIILAWLVTLPITGGISAALMAGLQHTV